VPVSHTPEIRVPRSKIPPRLWTPEEKPLFRKIAEHAQGWQQNPLVGGQLTPNVSYVEPPVASSTYSASQLLNKAT
jgi:hypothetical protein